MARRVPVGLNKESAGRRFGFSVGVAFLLVTLALLWRGHSVTMLVTGAAGLALVTLGLLAPALLVPVEKGWMVMAHGISRITTPIVLGIVYFLVITPIGLLLRVSGRNPLVHEESDEGSYWISTADGASRRGDMTRQF